MIHRGQIAGDRLCLSTRGDLPHKRVPGANALAHPVGEGADARRQGQRVSIRLDEIEVPVVDLEERSRVDENQVEEPGDLVALGNKSGDLA